MKSSLKKNVFLTIFFIILFIPLQGSLLNNLGKSNVPRIDLGVPIQSKLENATDTTFGLPIINPTNPAKNSNVSVSIDVSDPDGVSDVYLNYKYQYVSNNIHYLPMTSSDVSVTNATTPASPSRNQINVSLSGNYYQYNYTFIPSSGIVNVANFSLTPTNGKTITYLKVWYKDASTGNWMVDFENGTYGSTNTISNNADGITVDYSGKNIASAYTFIYVDYYSSGPLKDPVIVANFYRPGSFSAIIPAPFTSTNVTYSFVSHDLLGNQASSPTYSYLINTIHTVSITKYSTSMIKDQLLSVTAEINEPDGVNSIDRTSIQLNFRQIGHKWYSSPMTLLLDNSSTLTTYTANTRISDFLPAIDENIQINVTAKDNIGNIVSSANQLVAFDNGAPTLTSITLNGGTGQTNITKVGNQMSVSATFHDTHGNKNVSIYYSTDNKQTFDQIYLTNSSSLSNTTLTNVFTTTIPTAMKSGAVYYYFKTIDFLDISGTSKINVYLIADSNGNGILLKEYDNKSYIKPNASITIEVVSLSGIQSVDYNWNSIGQNTKITLNPNNDYTYNLVNKSPNTIGEHKFNVFVQDKNGLVTYYNYLLTIDPIAPLITLASPLENNSLVTSNTNISLTISDNFELFQTFYNWDQAPKDSSFSINYQTTAPDSDGDHYLTVTAVDKAGNSNSSLYRFIVDNTAPEIMLESIDNGTILQAGTQFNISVTDLHSISSVSYSWDNGQTTSTGNSSLVTIEALNANGSHSLTVIALDELSNSRSITFVFTIQGATPTTTNQTTNGNSFDIVGPLMILGAVGIIAGVGGGAFYFVKKNNIDLRSKGSGLYTKTKETVGKTAEKTSNYIKTKRPKKEE